MTEKMKIIVHLGVAQTGQTELIEGVPGNLTHRTSSLANVHLLIMRTAKILHHTVKEDVIVK